MLHQFLEANRSAVLDRWSTRAVERAAPRPLAAATEHGGASALLGQLIETLRLERAAFPAECTRPMAAFGFAGFKVASEVGAGAATYGRALFLQGLTIDRLVHSYGDLAQAIVELAIERDEPVRCDEFGILGRCVDQATAAAAAEFYRMRDRHLCAADHLALGERLGLLSHELRRHINTAMLCFVAIKEGGVGLHGATSAALEASLVGLNDLMEHALRDVHAHIGMPARIDRLEVEPVIAEAKVAASLEARSRGSELIVSPVQPGLAVYADTEMLHSAVFGLLKSALERTCPQGQVRLQAYATAERVLIEVEDECCGLPAGQAAASHPLGPGGAGVAPGDQGNGLSITRRAVEAMGGTLRLRDLPGVGCVSTIELPRPA